MENHDRQEGRTGTNTDIQTGKTQPRCARDGSENATGQQTANPQGEADSRTHWRRATTGGRVKF